MIPEAAVEAVARVQHSLRRPHLAWEALRERTRDYYIRDANLLLEAAAPHMLDRADALVRVEALLEQAEEDRRVRQDDNPTARIAYAVVDADELRAAIEATK